MLIYRDSDTARCCESITCLNSWGRRDAEATTVDVNRRQTVPPERQLDIVR